MTKFSAKSEKLFWSVGRAGGRSLLASLVRPATYGDFEKKIIRQKRFSDFAENFVMNSSPKIIFFNFGTSAKQLSYGFKNGF